MAAAVAAAIPHNAHLLDIGGGDGEPLNQLLALRPDLRVTTLDPGLVVGQWIETRFDGQVTRLPGTSLANYLETGRADPGAILIADVIHHIPESARAGLLRLGQGLLERVPQLRIIVKDVEPGHWRALLGYWSDRYITGDKDVSPISREKLRAALPRNAGASVAATIPPVETDRPNYAIIFSR